MGEEGADCLDLPKKGLWMILEKAEGKLVGAGCGVEVTGGETGRLTLVLSSSSGEESPLVVKVVQMIPFLGSLLISFWECPGFWVGLQVRPSCFF